MKQFQIFRAGKHIASNGTELTFSEEDLRAAVAAYDPELHEAPITVGHPKDNAPAYGWVRKLDFSDGVISAEADQIEAQFEEMVQAGRFKKRSASFYTPDSPANPKPGTYYLRHVAFLGAQPPAVKGLKDVNFAEEEGVLEFADSRYLASIMARFARSLREWVIADKGIETADKVTPDYLVADLEAEARRADDESLAGPNPAFSEDETMDKEKLQEQVTKLTADLAAANERAAKAEANTASFSEQSAALATREQELKAREQKIAQAAVEGRVEAAIKAGRLVPAQRKSVVDFAMALDDADAAIDFGEGDKAKKVSRREAYLLQVEAAPKVVDYQEHAGRTPGQGEGAVTPERIAEKARELVAAAEKAGRVISFTEAAAQAAVDLDQ